MSRPSETDKRYDRYAAIFDNPVNEHVLEMGNRALHWLFMENFAPYVARGTITQHAEEAVRQARERDPEAARRYDQRERRRTRGKPGFPVWRTVSSDRRAEQPSRRPRRARSSGISPAQVEAVQDRTRANLNRLNDVRSTSARRPSAPPTGRSR